MKDFEQFWDTIPVGEKNAISYDELCCQWGMKKRAVRNLLHELSCFDNKDNYILIRSARNKGFYRTDDADTIRAYKRECLSKGRSIFAPIKKINRVLENKNNTQWSVYNNLKAERLSRGIKQTEVVEFMKQFDSSFDVPTLSKMENDAFLPTPYQLLKLADFYGIKPNMLVDMDLYAADIFGAI